VDNSNPDSPHKQRSLRKSICSMRYRHAPASLPSSAEYAYQHASFSIAEYDPLSDARTAWSSVDLSAVSKLPFGTVSHPDTVDRSTSLDRGQNAFISSCTAGAPDPQSGQGAIVKSPPFDLLHTKG